MEYKVAERSRCDEHDARSLLQTDIPNDCQNLSTESWLRTLLFFRFVSESTACPGCPNLSPYLQAMKTCARQLYSTTFSTPRV